MMKHIKKIPLFLATLMVVSFFASMRTTYANDVFYSGNNIYYYDENAQTCSVSSNSVSTLRGTDNREKIYNYLKDKGLTNEQAVGVAANISHEGGYSPTRQEDPSPGNGYLQFPEGGWGIVQWTFGRRTNVVEYLKLKVPQLVNQFYKDEFGNAVSQSEGYVPKGMDVTSNDLLLLHELDFLYEESTHRNVRSVTVPHVDNVSAGDNEWESLKKQTTASKASNLWVYNFEVPGKIDETAKSRAAEAELLLATFNGTSTVSSADPCGDAGITGSIRERAVQVAELEYAAWEKGTKSPGSSFLEYTYSVEGDWCAWFVSWVYKEAKYPVNDNEKPFYASVTQFKNIAQEPGGKFDWQPNDGKYTPKPGDMGVYQSGGEFYHINMVVSAKSPTVVTTIGGNEGGDNFRQSSVKKSVDSTYWPERAAGYIVPTQEGILQ
jgi:hypothetical protein